MRIAAMEARCEAVSALQRGLTYVSNPPGRIAAKATMEHRTCIKGPCLLGRFASAGEASRVVVCAGDS